MKKLISVLICVLFASVGISGQAKIDRKAVVDRHRIVTTKTNPRSPAQVGNGEFAFSVDITGLQTFVPFNTMSQWSWHSFPLPEGCKVEDFKIRMEGMFLMSFQIPNNRNFRRGWQEIRTVLTWDVSDLS